MRIETIDQVTKFPVTLYESYANTQDVRKSLRGTVLETVYTTKRRGTPCVFNGADVLIITGGAEGNCACTTVYPAPAPHAIFTTLKEAEDWAGLNKVESTIPNPAKLTFDDTLHLVELSYDVDEGICNYGEFKLTRDWHSTNIQYSAPSGYGYLGLQTDSLYKAEVHYRDEIIKNHMLVEYNFYKNITSSQENIIEQMLKKRINQLIETMTQKLNMQKV